MSSTFRPSDIYGPPGADPGGGAPWQGPPPEPRGLRWPAIAGASLLVVVAIGVLSAPRQVGEGGIPPAVVDIVSEDQAIASLALYRAQAEVADALIVPGSLSAPPGPDVLLRSADAGAVEVAARLADARGIADADPAARTYWSDPAHDALLVRLRAAAGALSEYTLLAATHDSIYGGAGAIPLETAQFELTSRYATGGPDPSGPLALWGRALLAELDGQDAAAASAQARAAADPWWRERADALAPVQVDALRAYLGGLPESTRAGLEGHPVAGPGLARLRAG
jgi:hypothetical protein